jgi:regulator of sirC expression with transglutaminase-like and TPR domain
MEHFPGINIAITGPNLIALMRLLDEPQAASAEPLIDQLAAMPAEDLEQVVARCEEASEAARRNVQSALVRSRFRVLEPMWHNRLDLEAALTLISQTAESPPAINTAAMLDEFAEDVGRRLSGDRAFDSGLGALGDVLARDHGLHGNAGDYYSPDNSYLGHVLTSGAGNPIMLCSVAILVGRRLELPVWGINSPGHFLGFYGDVDLRVGSYFDGFDGYKRLNSGQVQALLTHFVEQYDPAMLTPASDREIVLRSLRNLAGSYIRLNQPEQVRNIERWIRLFQP